MVVMDTEACVHAASLDQQVKNDTISSVWQFEESIEFEGRARLFKFDLETSGWKPVASATKAQIVYSQSAGIECITSLAFLRALAEDGAVVDQFQCLIDSTPQRMDSTIPESDRTLVVEVASRPSEGATKEDAGIKSATNAIVAIAFDSVDIVEDFLMKNKSLQLQLKLPALQNHRLACLVPTINTLLRVVDQQRKMKGKRVTTIMSAFEAFDMNADEKLTAEELVQGFKSLNLPPPSAQELRQFFGDWDQDASGEIDKNEFLQAISICVSMDEKSRSTLDATVKQRDEFVKEGSIAHRPGGAHTVPHFEPHVTSHEMGPLPNNAIEHLIEQSSGKNATVSPEMFSLLCQSMQHQQDENLYLRHQNLKLSHELGVVQSDTELRQLYLMLKDWNAARDSARFATAEDQAAALKAAEMAVNKNYERRLCIFCSDMSGFSRVSKEEGIIHFLGLVKMMQCICLPLINANGGELVKVVGDNLFVVFENPMHCVKSAVECVIATRRYSRGKPRNDQIILSIGIDMGPMWVLPAVDCLGAAVNNAFSLGEDISEHEILVTPAVHALVAESQRNTSWRHEWCKHCKLEPRDAVDIGGNKFVPSALIPLHETEGHSISNLHIPHRFFYRTVIDSAINCTEPPYFASMMTKRMQSHYESRAQLKQFDRILDRRFRRECAVFTLQLYEQEDYLSSNGLVSFIHIVGVLKSKVRVQVRSFHGEEIQAIAHKIWAQVFAKFDSAANCLDACIRSFDAWDRDTSIGSRWTLSAGLSWGEMLDLDNGDGFGDPVNMAFKLGEDTAKGGEILVNRPFWNQLAREHGGLSSAELNEKYGNVSRVITVSHVKIPHRCVSWKSSTHAKLPLVVTRRTS